MITCPKCNKELADGSKFCDGCGAKIPDAVFCHQCGSPIEIGASFCQSCGAAAAKTAAAEPVTAQTTAARPASATPSAPPVQKKKLPKKALMFGGIGATAIIAIVLIFALIFGGGGENVFSLYLKDGEIFYNDLGGNPSWQLTDKLIDASVSFDNDRFASIGRNIGMYTCMSEDGKYLFFPDKLNPERNSVNLYFRDITNPGSEPVKIDSDVQAYKVNEDATLVTYLKSEDGNLYQYTIDGDSKDKIAGEVENFFVSPNGEKIIYYTAENSLYLKVAGKDRQKLVSDLTSVHFIDPEITTVYYSKDNTLYKYVEGKETQKLFSDFYDVVRIYDSGEIYYLTKQETQKTLMDYVIDDLKDADSVITEPAAPAYPNEPDYPYSWNYDSYTEYEAAYAAYQQAYEAYQNECTRLSNEYDAAYQLYSEKLKRDGLRESLTMNTPRTETSYTLHYFDGEKAQTVSEGLTDSYLHSYAADAAVISYDVLSKGEVQKLKLSEIEYAYDVEEMLSAAALYNTTDKYVAVKGQATVLQKEKGIQNLLFKADGTAVYYIDNADDETNHGDLYSIEITDGKLGKAALYDNDVYSYYISFTADGKLMYYKDRKEDKAELYIDKTRVDYDVYPGYVITLADVDEIYYMTDWNAEKQLGTLKMYDGSEAVKISDDVHDFTLKSDGRVLFLYDYSLNYYKGELHIWDGEKTKLDDDVVCIIPVYNLQ